MQHPQIDPINSAIGNLARQLYPVSSEWRPISEIDGRILAEPLLADRDSPALDVSAMDGYAIRLADLNDQWLPVQTTSVAGSPPTTLQSGMAVRIFTGAPVPTHADCIVRREDTTEAELSVRINLAASTLQSGQCIRRRGENARQHELILPAGKRVDAAAVAALASFGCSQICVRRKVRVTILNTGDELAQPGAAVADWQIRDSNGPTLQAWLGSLPWVDLIARARIGDQLEAVRDALQSRFDECDAIVLTGGVSMGDTDFVPKAIDEIGGRIVFHRLPIRPGKPVLGAALRGKLLLGLPGNPVSVAVTARVFGLPLLSALAGCSETGSAPPRPLVPLDAADENRLDLIWYRLVQVTADGKVALLASRGSGDLVSLSRSSGFVEVPAGASGIGPYRLTLW